MAIKEDSNITERMAIPRGLAAETYGACLVIISGSRLGKSIDLHDVPVVMGRSPECDFQIQHSSVSRTHCKVWHENNGFFVRDLGSTNRTFINDVPMDYAELKDGDCVAIGECVMKFVRRGTHEAYYHEALYLLASMDSLTQINNRRKFREILDENLFRSRKINQTLSLAIIDLDHFKAVNDNHGHDAGDNVLRAVSSAICAKLEPGEFAGRLGGDEFAILMLDTPLAMAMRKCEAFRQAISLASYPEQKPSNRIVASIGVAQLDEEMSSGADLLFAADTQLFRAKARGRNCIAAKE